LKNTEFKAALKARGWKYPDAAEALGKSVGTIKGYVTGNRKIPDEVVEALSAVASVPEEPVKKVGRSLAELRRENALLRDRIACLEMELKTIKGRGNIPISSPPANGDLRTGT
jgi:transcriptional regulator with XRE-family HTH domain